MAKLEIWFSEIRAVGSCAKCGEPSTGTIDSDEKEFELVCVSCGSIDIHKTKNVRLKIKQPEQGE